MSNLEIEGLDKLLKNLNKLAKEIPDVAEEELADIALDLGSKCSKAAPVESGDLRGELAKPRRKGPDVYKRQLIIHLKESNHGLIRSLKLNSYLLILMYIIVPT